MKRRRSHSPLAQLERFSTAWQQFWFKPTSCEPLGAMRWLVGGMLLYTHIVWGLQLDEFFSSTGWISEVALTSLNADSVATSLWWYVGDEHLRAVHLACLVVLVAYTIGLGTPLTSLAAFVITVSNSQRALIANYGLDQILALLTLYLAIGGCGGAYSVDQWLRSRWRRRQQAGSERAPPKKSSRARLGTRLIQVHYGLIYFFAGTSKLLGEAWWNGEAIWMALANAEYQSIDMTWLAHYPTLLQLLTHTTVLFEISFVFLIWNPAVRPFLLTMGIGMHLGIALCMGMPTFGLTMIYGYLAFVRPQRIRQVVRFFARLVSPSATQYKFSSAQPVPTIRHRVLYLEPATAGGKRHLQVVNPTLLGRLGYDVQRTSSMSEFEGRLMDGVYASSLVAMDRLEQRDAQTLIVLIERLSAHRIPCVLMLRSRQIDWLDDVKLASTVRVLVFPFYQSHLLEQINWSMHHADQPLNQLLDSDPGGFMLPLPKDPS